MIFYRRDFGWSKLHHPVISTVFLFIFGNLNGILSQHGAVKFHRRKGKFLGNVTVLDLGGISQLLPLDPLSSKTGGGNSRATAKGLEFGIHNLSIVVNLNLQFHDISTGRGANEASAHPI